MVSINITHTVTEHRANNRPPQYYKFGNFQSRGEIWSTNASRTLRTTHAVMLLPNQATELLVLLCPAAYGRHAVHAYALGLRRCVLPGPLRSRASWIGRSRSATLSLRCCATWGWRSRWTHQRGVWRTERSVEGLVLSVLGDGEDVR
ncbi:hypothetical protein B0H10DRAFT_2229972 [Mycena sp. CBHHK59/15]|nr:hypothetical protein B0H10DRAFT_2229972 [Mycena sp. CBHHK59/15]